MQILVDSQVKLISGETASRFILLIALENVGLRASAGFVTAMIFPPDDEIT